MATSASPGIGTAPEGRSFTPSRSLAIFLCAIPAIYCLAIMAYALLNFSAYGGDLPRFLRYIVAPGVVAAAFVIASLLLTPRKGANVGLAGSAVLFALLIVEIVLNARLVMAMLSLASMIGSDSVEGGVNARGHASIPPMFTSKELSTTMEVDRLEQAMLGGLPGEEVLLCSYNGQPLYYTADRYGYNNDDSVHDAPLEVMIVGDSFVEGHCQPRPDTFVGKMRNLRPQTAGIGMRGGGPLYELALIGRYGREFQPDWVVMAFYAGNDWSNLAQEARTPWIAEGLSADAEFGDSRPSPEQTELAGEAVTEMWAAESDPSDIFTKSEFLRNIIALNQVWGALGLDYPKVRYDQPLYADVIGRAKALTESWGGRFMLVYIPEEVRYRGLFDKSFLYDDLRSRVLDAAASQGVEVVDLAEVFGATGEPMDMFAADGHFSPIGSEVAARAVEARISALEGN